MRVLVQFEQTDITNASCGLRAKCAPCSSASSAMGVTMAARAIPAGRSGEHLATGVGLLATSQNDLGRRRRLAQDKTGTIELRIRNHEASSDCVD